jgi:predicted transcriptional regulator
MKLGKLKDEKVQTVMTVNGAKLKVFGYILRSGPATVFDIKKDLKMEQPNVFRILKRLLEENSVMLTKSEYTSRKRKYYGPTLYGLMNACGEDGRIIENFEDYYSKWIDHDGFRRSVQYMMRDEDMKKDPEKAMKILKSYVVYVMDCFQMYEDNKSKLPVEIQGYIGEMLMSMYEPEKSKKMAETFFEYIIPFKQNIDRFVKHTEKTRSELESKKIDESELT